MFLLDHQNYTHNNKWKSKKYKCWSWKVNAYKQNDKNTQTLEQLLQYFAHTVFSTVIIDTAIYTGTATDLFNKPEYSTTMPEKPLHYRHADDGIRWLPTLPDYQMHDRQHRRAQNWCSLRWRRWSTKGAINWWKPTQPTSKCRLLERRRPTARTSAAWRWTWTRRSWIWKCYQAQSAERSAIEQYAAHGLEGQWIKKLEHLR